MVGIGGGDEEGVEAVVGADGLGDGVGSADPGGAPVLGGEEGDLPMGGWAPGAGASVFVPESDGPPDAVVGGEGGAAVGDMAGLVGVNAAAVPAIAEATGEGAVVVGDEDAVGGLALALGGVVDGPAEVWGGGFDGEGVVEGFATEVDRLDGGGEAGGEEEEAAEEGAGQAWGVGVQGGDWVGEGGG